MKSPLAIYLHDHISGAQAAIELLTNLEKQHDGQVLGKFAAGLHEEVEKDLAKLERLADSIANHGAKPLKKVLTLIAAKGLKPKLHRRANKGLGTLETLEFLGLGILGKRALWRALNEVAPLVPNLRNTDFVHLADRAQNQYDRVEKLRLQIARSVLMQTG